jgi:succinate dehydrogenase / fumarate reductase cytochrome b subunit
MSLTGLFLILFLVVHCSVNSLMFFDDSGLLFNEVAHFFATNFFIRTIEIFLFAFLLLHIFQSLIITRQNMKARQVSYTGTSNTQTSKWYSRSMGILGTLILIFLIIHLRTFFIPSRFTDTLGFDDNGFPDMYNEVRLAFQNPTYAAFYIFSMIVLAYHLLHGFQSAFRTLGVYHKKYTPLIEFLGVAYTIIICGAFAAMPIYFLLKKLFERT